MVCGVESLSNVALNKDVRNQRQAPEGKCQYNKVRTCPGREEARNRSARPFRLDAEAVWMAGERHFQPSCYQSSSGHND
jgi:hypothetical protein